MKKSKGLFVILALTLPLGSAFAQKIQVAGVKKAMDCELVTRPLLADLPAVGFPEDWTIIVACNQEVWRLLQRRANATLTNTAFTQVENRITVINGMMYMETLPLKGSTHATPLAVLKHEHGHILCNCNDERKANAAGRAD